MWGSDVDVRPTHHSHYSATSSTQFLYPEALSDDDRFGMAEAETGLAKHSFIEVDEDLYTNVVLSVLSPSDIPATRILAVTLIIVVACLQCVLGCAILSHVNIAMSWTSASVKAKSMRELYENLRHDGRLEYLRLERKDVTQLCGDFQYDLEEKSLPGTNWTAYYTYSKLPVNNWHAWDIPPTDRSELDTARFVLENNEYVCVYVIVTFIWILTIINELRLVLQFMLAVVQMPLVSHTGERVLRQDGDEFTILAFTRVAKVMGLACVFYRIFISSFITWVGCQFLMWTSTNIELILNALALTFVLELDHITYKAAISRSRQNLISKLKRLTWSDPTFAESRMNLQKITMMVCTLGSSSLITYFLRKVQHSAYMDMFALVAATCLFQGPTPGYWSQFHATFPAPGMCETILNLRCEAPIVGEQGVPCVEDWNQKLCKFYVRTDSMFSTWSAIDWMGQGACVSFIDGKGPYAVPDLHIRESHTTFSIMANVCQRMWQQRPTIVFRGRQRAATGPRVRVYPYKEFTPAAPFWCEFKDGADAVLVQNGPAPFRTWRQRLKKCKKTTLMYSDKHTQASWVGNEQTSLEEKAVNEVNNMTESTGSFSGIWLSKTWGVVVISNIGDKAQVSNSNLPWSPVEAVLHDQQITIKSEPKIQGELREDGKIYLDNDIVLVSQQAEIARNAEQQNETKDGQGKHSFHHPFRLFFR